MKARLRNQAVYMLGLRASLSRRSDVLPILNSRSVNLGERPTSGQLAIQSVLFFPKMTCLVKSTNFQKPRYMYSFIGYVVYSFQT